MGVPSTTSGDDRQNQPKPESTRKAGYSDLFQGSVFLAEVAAMQHRHATGTGAAAPDPVAELKARNAVAAAQMSAGRPLAAVDTLKTLLQDCRQTLGEQHRETLTVEGNLAVAYIATGRPELGLPLLERNLASRSSVFGTEHLQTLTARNALATGFQTQDRLPDAIDLYLQVAAQRSRVLGPSHPDTLVSRLGLALARAEAGDMQIALEVLGAALQDAEQGSDKPSLFTVLLRAYAGSIHLELGDPALATDELTLALAQSLSLLDRTHSDVVWIRAELNAAKAAA